MIAKIDIEAYFCEYRNVPLIDVRSPSEFARGHIDGAFNVPLFNDAERAHIGTVYKQESREKAVELGYFYAEPKFDFYVEESQKFAPDKIVAVHCWRGGMRSAAFAEHLEKNGFHKIFLIENGYKAFRNFAIKTFSAHKKLIVLGGYTGSSKTEILHSMRKMNRQILDLEELAHHKGSAFGALGQMKQPTQEQFENLVFKGLFAMDSAKNIWVEDESYNIGNVKIPEAFFANLRSKKLIFIDIPKEERAKNLCNYYAFQNKQKLCEAVEKIKKRLGDLEARTACELIRSGQFFEAAMILLKYYDKSYMRVLDERRDFGIEYVKLPNTQTIENAEILIKLYDNE